MSATPSSPAHLPNRRALGRGVPAFVTAAGIEHAVAAHPVTIACWSVAGSCDFVMQVVAADLDTGADFAMTRIGRFPGIKAPGPWSVAPG